VTTTRVLDAFSTADAQAIRVLADTVEALVAAVYLDEGLAGARRVASLIVAANFGDIGELSRRDAKTALQELVQAGGGATPAYRLLAVEGPDHDRQFLVAVDISGRQLGEGRGRTKKLAEQAAAAAAIALVSKGATVLPGEGG